MITVKFLSGVYNAYQNLVNGQFYNITSETWKPPTGAQVVTFTNLKKAEQFAAASGLGEVKVIGAPEPMSQRPIANAATEEEVRAREVNTGVVPDGVGAIPPGKVVNIGPANLETLQKVFLGPAQYSDQLKDLINLFKTKRLNFSKRLKSNERAFLNGMAKVILYLYPHAPSLETALKESIMIEEKESEDLL